MYVWGQSLGYVWGHGVQAPFFRASLTHICLIHLTLSWLTDLEETPSYKPGRSQPPWPLWDSLCISGNTCGVRGSYPAHFSWWQLRCCVAHLGWKLHLWKGKGEEGKGNWRGQSKSFYSLMKIWALARHLNLAPKELLRHVLSIYEDIKIHDFIDICEIFIYVYKFIHTCVMRWNIYNPNSWHQNSIWARHCLWESADELLDWAGRKQSS